MLHHFFTLNNILYDKFSIKTRNLKLDITKIT